MCYDISFVSDIRQLSDYFPDIQYDSQSALDFSSFDHVQAPSVHAPHPIVYIHKEDGLPHCKLMNWGIIEFYQKTMPDFKKRNGMLNIRSERILGDTKSYWFKIKNRRCLIPVTGTFEHRGIKGWKNKVPYHIRPKVEGIFFIPGLYSMAELADKETGEITEHWTFAIITRSANDLMKNIHNDGNNRYRMPLFLPFETAKEFIQPDLSLERYAEILDYEMPSEELSVYPVYTIRTGKERPDGMSKEKPFDWPKLPELGVGNPE